MDVLFVTLMLATMNLTLVVNWLAYVVFVSSLLHLALTFLEGAIEIWKPRTPESRFWNYFDKPSRIF